MASEGVLLPPQRAKTLVDRLSQLPAVSRKGQGEAEALVHALADLEGAYRDYLDRELPALLREGLSDEEVLDALHEIAEGIAHVAYHLYEPEFFRLYVDRGHVNAEATKEQGEK